MYTPGPLRTPGEGFRVERLYANGDARNSPPLYFPPLSSTFSSFFLHFSLPSSSSSSHPPTHQTRVNRGQRTETSRSRFFLSFFLFNRRGLNREKHANRSRVLVSLSLFPASSSIYFIVPLTLIIPRYRIKRKKKATPLLSSTLSSFKIYTILLTARCSRMDK